MQRLDQYFANELQYLAEAGAEFARKHPQQAALLNPQHVKARDPHVERLFENFAFLTGSIRAKLDDELPELTQAMLSLLCPPLVRPIPSLTTLQLSPDFGQLSAKTVVPAGSYAESRPVTIEEIGEPIEFQFRTCYDVDLLPLTLASIQVLAAREGGEGLQLRFTVSPNGKWDPAEIDRVRLHICGDSHQMVYSIFYYLMRRVARVRLQVGETPVADGRICDVGFHRSQEAIPYQTHAFSGFRLLQEYFCFAEKFLYIDLCGLSQVREIATKKEFTATIWFNTELPSWWAKTVKTDHFQLFCTPAINLFPANADVDYDQRCSEYPIHASKYSPSAFQVYSVTSVVGRPRGDRFAAPLQFQPFLDFRHKPDGETHYYHVTHRRTAGRATEMVLSLTSASAPQVLPELDLSVDIVAFNGDWPQTLAPGDVCVRGEGMPGTVRSVRNLAPPQPMRPAVSGADSEWHVISQLAMNQLGLNDIESLTSHLRLFDWTADPANARRIEGVLGFDVSPKRAMVISRDGPIQGLDLALRIDESCFTDIGDAYLLSSVLRHYFTQYASLNSMVRLRTSCVPGKENWTWASLDGASTTL